MSSDASVNNSSFVVNQKEEVAGAALLVNGREKQCGAQSRAP
jgi:hypothetical protein